MNDEFTTPTPAMHMPDMSAMSGDSATMTPVHVEEDHEVKMAQGQLYRAAKNSIELHKMLKFVSELEGWVQAKITIAAENLEAVKNYIEYEMVSQTLAESQRQEKMEAAKSKKDPKKSPKEMKEGMGDVLSGLKKGAKEFWHGSPEERAGEHSELKSRWLSALKQVGIEGAQASIMADKMIAQGFEPNKTSLKESRPVKKRA